MTEKKIIQSIEMIADFKTRKISKTKNLDQVLRKARRTIGYSLAKVEKETKIKQEYLLMMEKGEINKLPDDVYVRGFLRSLARLYQLDEVELINCYREIKDSKIPNEKRTIDFRNTTIKKPIVVISPKIISIALGVIVGIGLLTYLWTEISGFAVAPKLILDQPANDEIAISINRLSIKGETDRNSSITINKESVPVGEDGRFKENIKLQPGYNLLNIQAKNQGGKTTSKVIKVVVGSKNEKISRARK